MTNDEGNREYGNQRHRHSPFAIRTSSLFRTSTLVIRHFLDELGPNRMSSPSYAAIEFKIVDETDDYLVVDKPPFLLTHPTKPDVQPTLWNELRELLAFEIANGGQVSIVNRLDRETCGLVFVAKTAAAARRFGLVMQPQRFHKEYLAIASGWPSWATKTVSAPVARQGIQ